MGSQVESTQVYAGAKEFSCGSGSWSGKKPPMVENRKSYGIVQDPNREIFYIAIYTYMYVDIGLDVAIDIDIGKRVSNDIDTIIDTNIDTKYRC